MLTKSMVSPCGFLFGLRYIRSGTSQDLHVNVSLPKVLSHNFKTLQSLRDTGRRFRPTCQPPAGLFAAVCDRRPSSAMVISPAVSAGKPSCTETKPPASAEGSDDGDPRAKGWPCHGTHTPLEKAVVYTNQYGKTDQCATCGITLKYTACAGFTGQYRKRPPPNIVRLAQEALQKSGVQVSNRLFKAKIDELVAQAKQGASAADVGEHHAAEASAAALETVLAGVQSMAEAATETLKEARTMLTSAKKHTSEAACTKHSGEVVSGLARSWSNAHERFGYLVLKLLDLHGPTTRFTRGCPG